MPYLAPQTMPREEQETLLRGSRSHPRDHLILSSALGTGLRLAEIVGLNTGEVHFTDGYPVLEFVLAGIHPFWNIRAMLLGRRREPHLLESHDGT